MTGPVTSQQSQVPKEFQIYKLIENGDYITAWDSLNSSEDYHCLFKKVTDLNCIQLLLNTPLTTDRQIFFSGLVNVCSDYTTLFDKLKENLLFKYTLNLNSKQNFHYLLEHKPELLQEEEISQCFEHIIKNNSVEECKALVKSLTKRNIKVIVKGPRSPFKQSIINNCPQIFKLFLSRISEAVSEEREILTCLKKKNIHVLSLIASQGHGKNYLQILSNHENEYLEKEVIAQINRLDHRMQTPLEKAVLSKNEGLVKELLQLGADPSLLPKKIKPSNKIKALLEKAEFGCIREKQGNPLLAQIFEEKREKGLLNSCKQGKLDIAKELIEDFKVSPSLTDEEGNSLIMVSLNHIFSSDELIKFIDFLGKDRINADQINTYGDNALTFAAQSSIATKVALHLINHFKAQFKLDHKNNEEYTIVEIAQRNRDLNVLHALSQKYPLHRNSEKDEFLSFVYSTFHELKKNELLQKKELNTLKAFSEKEISYLKQTLTTTQKELKVEKEKAESLTKNLQDLQKTTSKISSAFEEYKTKSQKESEQQKSQLSLILREVELLKKNQQDHLYREQQQRVFKLQNKITVKKQKLKTSTETADLLREKIVHIENTISTLKEEKEEFQRQLETATSEKTNPTQIYGTEKKWKRKINLDEFQSKLDKTNANLEKEEYSLNQSREALEQIETKIANLKSSIFNFERELQAFENLITTKRENISEFEGFDSLEFARKQMKSF